MPFVRAHPISRIASLALISVSVLPVARAQSTVHVDSLPQLALAPGIRFGDPLDPSTGIASVRYVVVDRDGQILFYENRERKIFIIGRDGRLVRTIGREGRGPGELTSVHSMGIIGDTIWTFDATSRRVNLFRRNGDLIVSRHMQPADVFAGIQGAVVSLTPFLMRPDGRFPSHTRRTYPPQERTSSEGVTLAIKTYRPTDTVKVPRILFDPTRLDVDTIGWEPLPPDAGRDNPTVLPPRLQVAGVKAALRVPVPQRDSSLQVTLPDGSAIVSRRRPASGSMATFDVLRYTMNGETKTHWRFSYSPVPFDSKALDSIAAHEAGSGPGTVAFQAVRRAMNYPSYMLPVARTWVGVDGSVWIRRESHGQRTVTWIVIDANGAPRGRLELPARLEPVWASDSRLVTMESDEDRGLWLQYHEIRPTR